MAMTRFGVELCTKLDSVSTSTNQITNRGWTHSSVLLILLLCAFSPRILAQSLPPVTSDDQMGEQAYQSYHGGDIDSVSLTSGTLSLNFPMLSYPQRGALHLSFNLMYNNQPQHQGQSCTQPPNPVCFWLWGYPTGGALPVERGNVYVSWGEQTGLVGQFIPNPIMDGKIITEVVFYSNWSLQLADGSKHPLGNMGGITTTTNGSWCGASGFQTLYYVCNTANGPFETLDATAWRVNGALNPCLILTGCFYGSLPSGMTAVDPNGLVYGNGTVQDPNGNKITSNSTTITDSLGRPIPLPPTSQSTGNPNDIQYCPVISGQPSVTTAVPWSPPIYNSGSQQYIFCYSNQYPQNLPSVNSSVCVQMGSVTRLQSIVLPNGQSWQFQYTDLDTSIPCSGQTVNFATLSQITLPTGGTISYTYNYAGSPTYNAQFAHGICQNYGRYVAARTVNANDGTGVHKWIYTYNGNSTIVTDPLGNDVVHTFAYPGGECQEYETQTQYYQGSYTSGTLLKTVNTTYSGASSANVLDGRIDVVPTNIQTVWQEALSTPTAQVTKSYDSGFAFSAWNGGQNTGIYGKVVKQQDYDFPAGTSLLRTTNTNYEAFVNSNYLTNNLLDLPYSVQVLSGSGTQMAYTTYGYDESSLQTSNISEQKVTGEAYPGNQTSVHRWLNGSTTGTTNCAAVTSGYLISTKVYYDTGEVQKSTDPCGNYSTYQYSSTYQGAFVTTATNMLSQNTYYGYDFNTGAVTSIEDPNQQTTTKNYDMLSRLTSVSYPDGGSTTYCYTDGVPANCPTGDTGSYPIAVVSTKVLSSTINEINTAVFDGLGRLSQTQLNSDPQGATYTLTTYDANGRKSQVYNPTRCWPITTKCTGETTWGITTNNYDALGRVTSVVEQDGSPVGTSYAAYPCTTVTDEAGNSRESCVDGLGRMIKVYEDPSHLNYLTNYTYDALGNLTYVNQVGSNGSARNRTFNYDSLSELTSAANPESGTILYAYDADGNAITKTAPSPNQLSPGTKTVVTTYTYDKLNRLLGKSYVDGYTSNPQTAPVTYGYDGNAPSGCTPPTVTAPAGSGIPTSPTNTIGRRSGMCDGSGGAAWVYDSMGRPTIEERTINSVTKNLGYVYYLDGHPNMLWYPNDDRMIFGITSAGRIDGVEDGIDNYVFTNAMFAPNGMLSGMSQFSRSGSYSVGVSSDFIYNQRLQRELEYAAYTGSSGSVYLYQRCYDYHLLGGMNITYGGFTCSSSTTTPGNNGNVYQISNMMTTARTQNFNYDALNRINQAYNNGATWGQQFNIDAWGNLTSVTAISGYPVIGGFTATATTSNQLSCTAGCTTSYDAAGNTLTTGNGAITYDDENRILTTNGVTYTYDGDGKRVEKSNGTLFWTGVGSDPLSESDLSGNINEEYVFFNGMRVARRDIPSNTVHAFLVDHLGSSRMSVVPSGTNTLTVEEDLDYTPYGIVATGSPTDHYEFNGKIRDSESGLDNFGARYNASNLGRLMTPDPLGGSLADPQTLNKYAYVANNPTTFTDPTGLYKCKDSNDCSSAGDQKFEKTLAGLRNSKDADVARAAAAYGAANADNGVTVGFADLSTKGENGNTVSTIGAASDGQSLRANSDVTINSKIDGDSYAAAIGHEGSHAADAQDVVRSGLTADGQTIHAGMDITHYQSEVRAWGVTQSILKTGNFTQAFGCGLNDCKLGANVAIGKEKMLPSQLGEVIDTILSNQRIYDQGGKPMGPNNQGGNIVNAVTLNPTGSLPH